MATTRDFAEFVLDQVNGHVARIRAMFGEYALYYNNKVVALICDNQVFVKITPQTTGILGAKHKTGLPYPGAKPAYIMSTEFLENGESFDALCAACAADLKPPKPRKKKSV